MRRIGLVLFLLGLAAAVWVGVDAGTPGARSEGPQPHAAEPPAPEAGLVGRPSMQADPPSTPTGGVAAMKQLRTPAPLNPSDTVVLEGRIVDPEGRALVGAQLRAEGTTRSWRRRTESDRRGMFRLAAVPRACFPVILRPTHEWCRLRARARPVEVISLEDVEGGSIEVVFVRGAWIEGTVIDDHGRSIAGARIGEHGTRSDADGDFRVAVEDGTTPVTLQVRPPPESEFEDTKFEALPGQRGVVVTLYVGAFIEGRVVDENGEPATGWVTWSRTHVRVVVTLGSVQTFPTTSDGRFRIGPVSGEGLLTLTGDLGSIDAMTVRAPAKDVVLVLRKLVRVKLKVRDGVSPVVRWFPDDSDLVVSPKRDFSSFRFGAPNPSPSAISLRVPRTSATVWVHDLDGGSALVAWSPDQGKNLVIELEPGRSIAGVVEGLPSGVRVHNGVTATHGRFTATGTIDAEGHFEIGGLTDGEWEIRVNSRDFGDGSLTIDSNVVTAEAGRDDVVLVWK